MILATNILFIVLYYRKRRELNDAHEHKMEVQANGPKEEEFSERVG